MTRKPLSPEAKAEAIARLQEVMRKFCEDVERRQANAELARRIADETGANV